MNCGLPDYTLYAWCTEVLNGFTAIKDISFGNCQTKRRPVIIAEWKTSGAEMNQGLQACKNKRAVRQQVRKEKKELVTNTQRSLKVNHPESSRWKMRFRPPKPEDERSKSRSGNVKQQVLELDSKRECDEKSLHSASSTEDMHQPDGESLSSTSRAGEIQEVIDLHDDLSIHAEIDRHDELGIRGVEENMREEMDPSKNGFNLDRSLGTFQPIPHSISVPQGTEYGAPIDVEDLLFEIHDGEANNSIACEDRFASKSGALNRIDERNRNCSEEGNERRTLKAE